MARFRAVLGLAAIFGVLLHGAMIVHHGTSMLGWMLQAQALNAGMGVICTGNGDMLPVAAPDGFALPPSAEDPPKCPICMGMGSAMAILAAPDADLRVPHEASARIVVIGEIIAQKLAFRPPSQGPPALV